MTVLILIGSKIYGNDEADRLARLTTAKRAGVSYTAHPLKRKRESTGGEVYVSMFNSPAPSSLRF